MHTAHKFATAAMLAILACEPAIAEDESPVPNTAQDQPLKRGANSFAESQARALLQSHGYQDISVLMNDQNGIWRGTATKERKRVNVSVDYQGHVAEQ